MFVVSVIGGNFFWGFVFDQKRLILRVSVIETIALKIAIQIERWDMFILVGHRFLQLNNIITMFN
jgi:hypothetical protein